MKQTQKTNKYTNSNTNNNNILQEDLAAENNL